MNQVEDAFRTWVKTATGLADNNIFFQDQKVERPTSTYVTIRVGSVVPLGAVDPVTITEVTDPVPGQEIQISVDGIREVTTSIQVFGPAVSTNPTATAMYIANKIQTSLRLPSVQDALDSAGISVFDIGAVNNLTQLLDTGFDGRAQFDVRCYIVFSVSQFETYIETAEVTDNTTGETYTIETS